GRLAQFSGDAKGAALDLEQARSLLLAEAARQPGNPGPALSLAWTYCFLGDRDNALKYAEKAIALASEDVSTQLANEEVRMNILAYFGDREKAIPEIERLLKVA